MLAAILRKLAERVERLGIAACRGDYVDPEEADDIARQLRELAGAVSAPVSAGEPVEHVREVKP